MSRLEICVVSHTHWDREWYLAFETFRLKLHAVVGKVLDLLEADSGFDHFVLDGQAIVLEDLLQIEPGWADRIRRQVEAGRLSIGPWYILPDEFLVSAEATARNLLLGTRVCRDFGGAALVGYLPDTFGHLEQMPQILRKAGIDSFIYTRGSGDEIVTLGSEWHWQAPDGSQVLAVNQEGGYCYGSALGFEEIWEIHIPRTCDLELAVTQFEQRIERLRGVSNSRVLLFNNGCDHHPPQPQLGEILTRVARRHADWQIHHCGHREFLKRLRQEAPQLQTHSGELLGGRQAHLLSGVWSARMPLKQANDRAQRLLEKVLEPLAVMARINCGAHLPAELLRSTWKRLLANHPHDSICGCSTDEVHQEMETRFRSLFQSLDESLRRVTDPMTPVFAPLKADDHAHVLSVHNSLPFARDEVVERWVILLPGDDPIEELSLLDDSGVALPFEVVERHWLERFWGIDYRGQLWTGEQEERIRGYLEDFGERIRRKQGDEGLVDQFVKLRFRTALPACGHARFQLCPGEALPQAISSTATSRVISAEESTLENRLLKVWLHPDGRFDLLHKESGDTYHGLGLLLDEEDCGDEYDWSPTEENLCLSSEGASGLIDTPESDGLRASLSWSGELLLPESLDLQRRQRAENRVACPVTIRLSLDAESPQLDLQVGIDNRAKDHRLRMAFPTGIAGESLLSHGQFRVHRRGLDLPSGEDWVQRPQPTKPQQDWSAIEEKGRGLALFNLGLPEIEARPDSQGRLVLLQTLLRSVGWLSRDDFQSRGHCNAGPTLATPGAQCLGEHTFNLALMPYQGNWRQAAVQRSSQAWRVPVLVRQGVEAGSLPSSGSLLQQAHPGCVEITAIKQAEDRDSVIVRLCNLLEVPLSEELSCGVELVEAWSTTLLEERIAALSHTRHGITLDLGPCELRTVELVLVPVQSGSRFQRNSGIS